MLEAPTVSLDFSYYLTDGENERLLGFVNDGQHQNLSGLMTREQNEYGNNYFILTVPEGRDAIKGDQLVDEENKTAISLGNGYVMTILWKPVLELFQRRLLRLRA